MLRPTILVLCLAASGCSFGLDESTLSSGRDLGAPPEADLGSPADLGGYGPQVCYDFSPDDMGLPDGWHSGSGTWEELVVDGAGALAQTTPSMPDGFYTATLNVAGAKRARIVADLIVAGGGEECVLNRHLDRDHYYALCLINRTSWALLKYELGTVTTLVGGTLATAVGSRHTLELDADEITLTAIVDQKPPVKVNDKLLQQGMPGLGTETTTIYTRVCTQTGF